MNRLSILNGSLPTNTKQNIKEAAYIQYLKSFAQNGLETLQKLEAQFQKHFSRHKISQDLKLFQKLNTLISAYQVFILEINDSCDFIEVPEFGTCILKTFIQLMGILKWSFQHLVSHKKVEGIVVHAMQNINLSFNSTNSNYTSNSTAQMTSTMNSTSPMNQNFIHTAARRDSSVMRNTFNGVFSSTQSKCQQCMKLQQSNNAYRMKQLTKLQLKDINEQISRITKEYNEQQKQAKKQQVQRNQLKKFIQKRQEQDKGYMTIGLTQHSKNEQILTQILYTLNRKGQAMGRFADLRMSSLNQATRIHQSTQQQYETFKTEISSQLSQKVSLAKAQIIILYQKSKQQRMIQIGIQIQESESIKMQKLHQQKTVKHLKQQIKKLQKQLIYERDVNEAMKKLLKDKAIYFQQQVIKYRNQLINLEFRSRKDILKSARKVRNSSPNQKQTPLKYNNNEEEDRSLVSIDGNDLQDKNIKFIRYNQERSSSEESVQYKFTNTKNCLQTKKKLSKSKAFIKFQQPIEKYPNLHIYSSVIQFHQPLDLVQQNLNFKRLSNISSKFTRIDKQVEYLNKEVQTCSTKLFNELTRQQNSKSMRLTQKRTNLLSASKVAPTLLCSKSKKSIISYKKKRSSHMGDLCEYFEIQKDFQGRSLFNRLIQKNIKINPKHIAIHVSHQQKQAENDFVPLTIRTEFKDMTNLIRYPVKKLKIKTNQIHSEQINHQNQKQKQKEQTILKIQQLSKVDSELIVNDDLMNRNPSSESLIDKQKFIKWQDQDRKKDFHRFGRMQRNQFSASNRNISKKFLRNFSNVQSICNKYEKY